MSSKSIIEDLLETPFSARSFSEKLLIVENGRPCPKLKSKLKSVHADRTRAYTRHFNENQYTLYPWLAGCENKAKLFCWPCMLFSRANSPWNSTGVSNLNALQSAQKKHKQSIAHLQCVLMLASFSERRVDQALSMQIRELNSQHNLKVKKNREVLKRLIDVTCFLANQELPFRRHDESANSLNRGNYIELLNLLKRYDSTLAEHFQTAAVFKDRSMTIQNNLIKAVGELLNSHICKQLELSEFVAIMLDESSDIQMESQLSVVFRYCLKGKVHETFVGFIDVSNSKSVEDVFILVKTLLQKYNVLQKLVAQTYDGAAVRGGQINELQSKVRELCPNALFVHCYAHILNLVLSQGLNIIRGCNIFFTTINGIATFTSHSSKKTHSLKEYLKQRIPSLATMRWCFSSQLVNIVHTYRDAIVEFFDSIKNDDSVWESKDRMAAHGYSKFLKSFETVFMLKVFSKLFTHSDTLFNTLQSKNLDIILCVNQINNFVSFLRTQKKKESFLEIWQCTSEAVQTPIQKQMNDQFDSDQTIYKKLFYEIVDNLIMQISERFSSFEKLKCFDLLKGKKFVEYAEKNNFPESIVSNLIELFKDIFEYSQLKNELIVLYSSSEVIQHYVNSVSMEIEGMASTSSKNITPYDVLFYIENKNLNTSFEQVYKLTNLICTIPATTVPIKRRFSALKRIKTYLRSTQGQERRSFLALLSIEKEKLSELRSSNDFYDRVIENFLSVEQHVDFMYK